MSASKATARSSDAWHGPTHAIRLQLPSRGRLIVAFSGGADSTALLWLTSRQAPARAHALHVHHGLTDQADDWAEHCRRVCEGLGVPFHLRRVTPQGNSETAAREARYSAFEDFAIEGDAILTAHHREDQAETVLLNLLRGSGVKGLAGIPAWRPLGAAQVVRPLLAISREDLRATARAAGLGWVEDPTNRDEGVRRNQLRQRLLAACLEIEPAAVDRIAHSASLCRQASQMIDLVAAEDVARATGDTTHCLTVGSLQALPATRRREALRSWLNQLELPPPPGSRLTELDRQLSAEHDRQIVIHWPGAEVRRYRGELYAGLPLQFPDSDKSLRFDQLELSLPANTGVLRWLGGDRPPLAAVVRFGCPGQSLRVAVDGPSRKVKKLFQEAGVPPWERRRTPYLFSRQGELLAVADRWLDGQFAKRLESMAMRLVWDRREFSPRD